MRRDGRKALSAAIRTAPQAEPGDACEARFSDRVLANRLVYRFKEPKRGDVIVFKTPPEAEQECGANRTGRAEHECSLVECRGVEKANLMIRPIGPAGWLPAEHDLPEGGVAAQELVGVFD